jgi:hypothetical protein
MPPMDRRRFANTEKRARFVAKILKFLAQRVAKLYLGRYWKRRVAEDANVSIGIYAGVLLALGMLEGLGNLADIGNDPTGQVLASAALPKRVHLSPPPAGPRNG